MSATRRRTILRSAKVGTITHAAARAVVIAVRDGNGTSTAYRRTAGAAATGPRRFAKKVLTRKK